jgi:thiol-disulfide isomerase/thioredoxin
LDYTRPYSKTEDPDATNEMGQSAPNFAFKSSEDNKTYQLSDFKNKIVMINFWASWCPPCRHESHTLVNLARRNPKDMVLILLSEDDTPEKAVDFAHSLPAANNIYVAWDGRERTAQNIFQTFRYPETIVVAPGGRIRHKIIGEISLEELKEIDDEVH